MQFLKDLQAGNAKARPGAHNVCETAVRELMAALPAELSGQFGPGPTARPGQDVRFPGR